MTAPRLASATAQEIREALDRSPTLAPERVEQWTADSGLDLLRFADALVSLAAERACAPTSGYPVGAVIVEPRTDGRARLHLGANLELRGLPLGHSVHAEQVAVSHAVLAGAASVQTLCVSAPPCGHCRQFLQEVTDPGGLEIRIAGPADEPRVAPLSALLPDAFGPSDLGFADTVLFSRPEPASLARVAPGGLDPELVFAAQNAAHRSYAPYSGVLAGAALRLSNGDVVPGRSLESAAYNPSLPPLHAALARAAFSGRGSLPSLAAAVLVEKAGKLSHRTLAAAALVAVAPGLRLGYATLAELGS